MGKISGRTSQKTLANTQGQLAEELACEYLLTQGLKLITKNYRCKLGEIDLIMQDKDFLVFIEVRFRRSNYSGGAIESVDYFKQKKLLRTAQLYLSQKRLTDKVPCRIDVIAMKKLEIKEILWIKNAV